MAQPHYLDEEGLRDLVSKIQGMADGQTLEYSKETGLRIKDGGVTSEKIADNAVTSNKISDGSIVSSKIEDGAITDEKVVGGSIGGTGPFSGDVFNSFSKTTASNQSISESSINLYTYQSYPGVAIIDNVFIDSENNEAIIASTANNGASTSYASFARISSEGVISKHKTTTAFPSGRKLFASAVMKNEDGSFSFKEIYKLGTNNASLYLNVISISEDNVISVETDVATTGLSGKTCLDHKNLVDRDLGIMDVFSELTYPEDGSMEFFATSLSKENVFSNYSLGTVKISTRWDVYGEPYYIYNQPPCEKDRTFLVVKEETGTSGNSGTRYYARVSVVKRQSDGRLKITSTYKRDSYVWGSALKLWSPWIGETSGAFSLHFWDDDKKYIVSSGTSLFLVEVNKTWSSEEDVIPVKKAFNSAIFPSSNATSSSVEVKNVGFSSIKEKMLASVNDTNFFNLEDKYSQVITSPIFSASTTKAGRKGVVGKFNNGLIIVVGTISFSGSSYYYNFEDNMSSDKSIYVSIFSKEA